MGLPKKYYIRFSTVDDHEKLMEFYDVNKHTNVFKRQEAILKEVADEGLVILVEDAAGKIVGASISYGHKGKDAHGIETVRWQEVGTTRVVLNGYPEMFDALIGLQVLKTFMVEPPEDRFVCQVDTTAVQKMAARQGWKPFKGKTDDLAHAKHMTVSSGDMHASATENWFECGVDNLPHLAKFIVKTLDTPVLENKKTGEKIELDFSKMKFIKYFEPEIRHLAQQNFSDPKHTNVTQSPVKVQKKWLKTLFR